ncbi:CbtA family protein [Brucella intermedia]|uniref:Cobalt transporter subunit CbtA n=2 Tax=Brucella intermedia TaxID=94625 RepID=A0ABR6AJ44_9HYPH|nr:MULTISPECIES: CbtA family protein [Brucella]KAB2696912.1 cobalt transporter [Brucella intermedia]KAB2708364.1 cobalt transporter [Brucella intermedia]MBA8849450.1 cobalt transporter subunit CbtA [Brucella intermedia]MCH6204864.1 CbtA family protein [Brucella ciceri]MDH0122720.1 CbtA family protein [Brucella intermedia GD04153]
MLIRYLLASLAAGLLAGLLVTPAMYLRTVPLILQAETFEEAGGGHSHGEVEAAPHDHGAVTADAEEEGAELPFGRLGNTILANLVAGAGFALLLGGVALLLGRRITVQNGIYWGVAGFFAVAFLPALGLSPELPAMPAADLAERQLWWIAAVVLSGLGIYLVVLRQEIWAKILGLVLIVAPQLYGAPHPEDISSPVPALLASQYAVASLATNLFMWAVIGLALGWFIQHYASSEIEG